MDGSAPKTPNSTKKPPTKRRRFTTSPHPGRDGRALPRPITRPGSLQALRKRGRHPLRRPVIQGERGVKRSTSTTSPLTLIPLHPSSAWIARPARSQPICTPKLVVHRNRCYAPALIAQVRGSSASSAAAAAAGAEEQAPHWTTCLAWCAVGWNRSGGDENSSAFPIPSRRCLTPSPFGGGERG